jgi:ketosteroid isomerase-like protein
MRILLFVLLFADSLKTELDSLAQAEREFARLSLAQGVRDAFLANLGEDSIIFRPNAVAGRQWFENNPPPPTLRLEWAPEFADIASSGDLGYTTGPFERRRTPQDPPAFGHYVTLWRKQADGKWKVALDTGISHAMSPKPASVASPRISSDVQKQRAPNEIEAARAALVQREGRYSSDPQSVLVQLDSAARVYREGGFPVMGRNAIRDALSGVKGAFTWKLTKVEVSKSADFGYTYGTADFKPADASKPIESSNFVRIWKKQGADWKVLLDLLD